MESKAPGQTRNTPNNQNKRQTGQRAEAIAAAALEQAGYTILDRNWRCVGGEIDLVAQHRGEIVIVEVRARAGGRDGEAIDTALESIGKAKRARLIRLAYAYLEQHHLDDVAFRIDVVAIGLSSSPPTVEIIENAVGW